MHEVQDKIIFPLDYKEYGQAATMAELLFDHVNEFKLGLIPITAGYAHRLADELIQKGKRVSWDGKFNDVDGTVGGAAEQAAKRGVCWFNLHASSGINSIKAAVANRGNSDVYGVTVLTSIEEDECESIFGNNPEKKVVQFSFILKEGEAQGVICSPKELLAVRAEKELAHLRIITPGIRPAWAKTGHQRRKMTPREAMASGADYLVIGDPIANPPTDIGSPINAIESIVEEMIQGMTDRTKMATA